MRILIFGDSITYGAWDSEGGWADRLKRWAHQRFLANGTKLQVINLGVGSDTSKKIRARIKQEIFARHSASWPFVIILMFGSNDGRVRDGIVEVPIEEFTDNYREIIRLAKSYTDRIIIVGLPPLGKPVLNFKEMQYSDETLRQYDTKIQKLAQENNITYVDIQPLFTGRDVFADDMLHPNDMGHEYIYDAVKTEIEKILD